MRFNESISDRLKRSEEIYELSIQERKLKQTPHAERTGVPVAILEARRRARKRVVCNNIFDHHGWKNWHAWKMAVAAEREVAAIDGEDIMQSVAVRAASKAERQREVRDLKRLKRKETRRRLRAGLGHCERDCDAPGQCFQVLSQALDEEEQRQKEAEKQKSEESRISGETYLKISTLRSGLTYTII